MTTQSSQPRKPHVRFTISLSDHLASRISEAAERAGEPVSVWIARAADRALFAESLARLRHEELDAAQEAHLRAMLNWQQDAAASEDTGRQAA